MASKQINIYAKICRKEVKKWEKEHSTADGRNKQEDKGGSMLCCKEEKHLNILALKKKENKEDFLAWLVLFVFVFSDTRCEW